MAAGEEIDLTGLDKQIKDVQNDIQKLGRSFDIASKDIQRFGLRDQGCRNTGGGNKETQKGIGSKAQAR